MDPDPGWRQQLSVAQVICPHSTIKCCYHPTTRFCNGRKRIKASRGRVLLFPGQRRPFPLTSPQDASLQFESNEMLQRRLCRTRLVRAASAVIATSNPARCN